MIERVNCVNCGNLPNKKNLIGVFNDYQFGIPGDFPLVRCHRCGLIYFFIRPCQNEIFKYYDEGYLPYKKAIQDERNWMIRWIRTRNINKLCNKVETLCNIKKGRILDIGCSTGIFLDGMNNRGWSTKGVDINKHAVNYAQKRFRLDVVEGQFSTFDVPDNSFDAITMWDVLEHLHNPITTLVGVHKKLKSGGMLFLAIPNWESLDRRIFGTSWIGYDAPRHLYVFPKKLMEEILLKNGFQVIKMKCDDDGYYTFLSSLRIWLNLHRKSEKWKKQILSILYLPGVRYFFQPLIYLINLLGLGGKIFIVARKQSQNYQY